MAGFTEKLALVVQADAKGAIRELQKTGDVAAREMGRASQATEKWSRRLTAGGATAVGVAAVAGAGLWKLGSAASDLNETVSKTGVIFGDNAGDLREWASTSAESFGQSQRSALDAASTFGMFGKGAGLTGDQLVNFSTKLTELASDMASFSNTSPEDAVLALGAALRGENEPIRRYNVLLDDATLRQEALSMGLISTTKDALTPQQKTLAAYNAILKQTIDQQGDWDRTADGAANQQRRFNAELEDFAAGVGAGVVPAMQQMLGAASGLLGAFNGLSPEVQKAVGTGATLATAAVGIAGAMSLVAGATLRARANFAGFAETAPRTAAAIGAVAKTAGVAGTALAALSVLNSLTDDADDSADTIEHLAFSLRDFADHAVATGLLAQTFGGDLGKLADDAQLVQDKLKDQSGFESATEGVGHFATAVANAIPFVGDVASDADEAQQRLDELDKALASIATSNGPLAAQIFAQISAALAAQGVDVSILPDIFNDYEDAQTGAANASDDAAAGMDNVAGAAGGVESNVDGAARALREYAQATLSTWDAGLDAADSGMALDEALADLADSGDGAADSVGGAGGAAQTAAEAFYDAQDQARSLADAMDSAQDAAQNLAEAQHAYNEAVNGTTDADKQKSAEEKLADARLDLRDANLDITEAERRLSQARRDGDWVAVQRAEIDLARARARQRDAVEAVEEAQRVYNGTLHGFARDSEEVQTAQENLTDAQDAAEQTAYDLAKAQAEARGEFEKAGGAAGSAAGHVKTYAERLRDAAKAARDFAEDQADATGAAAFSRDWLTAFIAQLQAIIAVNPVLSAALGPLLDDLKADMQRIPTNTGVGQQFIRKHAHGGMLDEGLNIVGEQGPELAIKRGGSVQIIPNHQIGSMSGGRPVTSAAAVTPAGQTFNITVNMPPGSDGEDVVNALRKWQRRNGPLPVKVAS